ncbi:MAG TPA: STAS domain-containing protein [Planctomycetota bacterium]|nr:STAS domain-containing protein [Planctomycetota bacterium]
MIRLTSAARGKLAVIRVEGEVQSADNQAFAEALRRLPPPPAGRMVLDLSALEYLNSRGLGDLMLFYQDARARGQEMAAAGARPAVLKVMRVVGLDRFVPCFDTVEAAERAWSGR